MNLLGVASLPQENAGKVDNKTAHLIDVTFAVV